MLFLILSGVFFLYQAHILLSALRADITNVFYTNLRKVNYEFLFKYVYRQGIAPSKSVYSV